MRRSTRSARNSPRLKRRETQKIKKQVSCTVELQLTSETFFGQVRKKEAEDYAVELKAGLVAVCSWPVDIPSLAVMFGVYPHPNVHQTPGLQRVRGCYWKSASDLGEAGAASFGHQGGSFMVKICQKWSSQHSCSN